MRGTQRVGSLLRLFVCGAFLCLAWVLFSSAQAHAAEHPAPVGPVASMAEQGRAHASSVAAVRASAHPIGRALGHSVVAVRGKPNSPALPVVEQLRETTAAGVDAGAQELKALAAAVPVLEAPAVVVADAVVAVADALPVVGNHPLGDVPLPGPTDSSATQGNPLPEVTTANAPRGLVRASFDADVSRNDLRSAAGVGRSPRSAAPEPADAPEPLPAPRSPMPPSHSVPNPGGGASSDDVASIGPAFVLPLLTLWGSRFSDWRVPGGLPAQPGSRPD